MATDKSGSTVRTGFPADGETPLHFTLRSRIDCGDDNVADNGVVNMIDVARGDLVWIVVAEIVTAEGGTLVFEVGDGDDSDGFIAAANGNATAGTRYPQTVFKGYTAADTIDITMRDAADLAVIELAAVIVHVPYITAA